MTMLDFKRDTFWADEDFKEMNDLLTSGSLSKEEMKELKTICEEHVEILKGLIKRGTN